MIHVRNAKGTTGIFNAYSHLSAGGTVAVPVASMLVMLVVAVAAVALAGLTDLHAGVYAQEEQEMIIVSDPRTDAPSNGDEITIGYYGLGLNITKAVLQDLPFLALTMAFDGSAPPSGGASLEITLLDAVFDPMFDGDHGILIVTDAGMHDDFEIVSDRTLLIRGITLGAEVVDVYLEPKEGPGAGAPESAAGTQEDAPRDGGDGTESGDDGSDSGDIDEPGSGDSLAGGQETQQDATDSNPSAGDLDEIPSDSDFDAPPTEPAPGSGADVVGAAPDTATLDDADQDIVKDVLILSPDSDAPPDTETLQGDAPPQDSVCGPGTMLVDNVCVLDESSGATGTACGPGTMLVDNVCVLDESSGAAGAADSESGSVTDDTVATIRDTSGSDSKNGRELIAATIGGFAAAGVISVILALMARASRRKRSEPAVTPSV